MNLSEHFMQKLSKSSGATGAGGARPTPATVYVRPTCENSMGAHRGDRGAGQSSAPLAPLGPSGKNASGTGANIGGSRLRPTCPTRPGENDILCTASGPTSTRAASCPLRQLNAHDIGVDISTKRGLILTAGFAMTEVLRAHLTLWVLGQWDALLAALGREGAELPRKVEVRSVNCYQLLREGRA